MNTAIIIAGPTAAGKTSLAIRLARHFGTRIISADSRQCYREITIGTAKPTPAQLAAVPHYFINSHSIREQVSAGIYERLSLGYAAAIFASHPVAIICGGTGLYLRAFAEGIDEMPAIPPPVREAVRQAYAQHGLPWLQAQLQQRDPAFYATAETGNPHRLLRALEVLEATGHSISSFRTSSPHPRDFRIIKIGVTLPKPELHANIHQRVDEMMAEGLVEEVRSVLPYRSHNALQTVGYQELFQYLDGTLSLPEAVDQIKTHTRQYAKRQLTWFARDQDYHWFNPQEEEKIIAFITQELDKV
ncbi:tRNA dimethylallyltransferase [Chitinophaga costaii]|uniref:tRNA dimethylallyltransferase n=1 Tax=Chitinophaga costaii TaxID=1335309 RepID=A0A1C4ESE1_9BACT|nr:tRNA (adenosine(37)-N6)-dimethylallyltransferase MiaA [Chitinophaga costaii]PUZ22563.1 tRNA (adenosine(37)-N6)-dimethylallyltransferase MiaA [Chitinophaga costaii]SCC46520.1 tRNA dimethylallyltransferase [Chitinophaga costaii]